VQAFGTQTGASSAPSLLSEGVLGLQLPGTLQTSSGPQQEGLALRAFGALQAATGQPAATGAFADKGTALLVLQQQQAAQQAQAQAAAQTITHSSGHPAGSQSQFAGLSTTPGSGLSGQPSGDRAPPVEASVHEQTVIPNLSSYVIINAGLQLFSQQPQLKRIVPIAIDRAIREIISPVVERSVTISCVTTRELMLKDFAMEPDEMRMRNAAQLMVQNLAGSLALVTCKEPLRVACGNHMRSLLQQAGTDAQLMEQVVQVCSSDNLELGCTLIEKAATEKAVRDIEEALAPAFAIRRKHREQTGLPYYDMSIFTSGRYPASLPEALRPKPGGLQPTQRRVYDDFGRIPRSAASVQPNPPVSVPAQCRRNNKATALSTLLSS
jgi:CCR4-NOT transcription complex subunit 1